ncbi:MAG: InlB B-repeat-containing protein [Eggerthellaceae bacterium]
MTVFAQWTKNQEQNDHAVMYVANGGQFATGETFQQGVTDSDGMMRQPAAPTRDGYTFDGWYWHADYSGYTDEQKAADKVDFSQPVQSDVNIYAQWTKNADQNEIDVLYAANGGQFATGETFQQGVTDSDGMMRQPAEPTREGYTFDGWYWVFRPLRPHRRAEGPEQGRLLPVRCRQGARDRVRPVDQEPGAERPCRDVRR